MAFSITWHFVSLVLFAEIALLVLLILPSNTFIRKLLVENINNVYDNSRIVRRAVLVVFTLVALFFVDAIRTVWQYEAYTSGERVHLDAQLLVQNTLFYNQRNAYLTGLTLFLGLLLYRMLRLLAQLNESRLKLKAYEAKYGAVSVSDISSPPTKKKDL